MSANILPLYKSHKVVQAAKIESIETAEDGIVDDDSFVSVGTRYGSFDLKKPHTGAIEIGGYIVVYEDGYSSYSPAKPFEEGYTAALSEEEKANFLKSENIGQFFSY